MGISSPTPAASRRLRPRDPRAPSRGLALAAALALFTTLLAGASPAAAQSAAAGLVITVRGSDGFPLPNARVTLDGSDARARTERDGRFQMSGLEAGSHVLNVTALGYQRARMDVDLVAGEVSRMAVTLQVAPVALEALEVEGAEELPPELRGFYRRRSRGAGHYFTRPEIERMQPRQLTDVLRRVPGLRINNTSGPFGSSQTAQTGRSGGPRSCSVQFYVNGIPFPVAGDVGINTFIRPDEVAAVEVYSGSAQIPPQFNSSQSDARCGVVAIWTRSSNT
ncbi:MAG TPA: DUF2012 domain-containing protein [Longimicrobium sp.]|nr:DUF2012 domain-containing protein [Longimicrobium sp.]